MDAGRLPSNLGIPPVTHQRFIDRLQHVRPTELTRQQEQEHEPEPVADHVTLRAQPAPARPLHDQAEAPSSDPHPSTLQADEQFAALRHDFESRLEQQPRSLLDHAEQALFSPAGFSAPAPAPVEAPPAPAPVDAPPALAPVEAPPAPAPVDAPPALAPVDAPPALAPVDAPPALAPVDAPTAPLPPDRPAKDALIDGMLARAPRPTPVDPAVLESLQAELSHIPLSVLQTIDRNGTGLAVLKQGQSPLDLGLVRPLDVAAGFADVPALAGTVDRHVSSAEAGRGKNVADNLAKVRTIEALHVQGKGAYAYRSDRPRLQTRVYMDSESARMSAFAAITGETEGRVLSYPPREPGQDIKQCVARAFTPVTLEQVAREHGARTPDEIQQFCDITRRLNGERLTRWQGEHAAHAAATTPPPSAGDPPAKDVPAHQDLPVEKKPFILAGSLMAVPNLYYARSGDDRPGIPVNGHDFASLQGWQQGNMLGQCWGNTVLLHEKHLGASDEGSSTPVHEMGHAYENAVAALEPEAYQSFREERDCTVIDMKGLLPGSSGEKPPTAYALTNGGELVAESFADRYGAKPSRLHDLAPQWAATFDAFLDESERLSRPSGPS